MLGIFDSGIGGLASHKTVREIFKRENTVYLADRKNCPYGTKSKKELIFLVSRNLKRLSELGCRRALIACCTASTVYPYLDEALQSFASPIITPAAKASGGGRVTVIATQYTVSTHAFKNEISAVYPSARTDEIPAQELVLLIEAGLRDGALTSEGKRTVNKLANEISATRPDSLILGCTHFSHLEKTFSALLPGVRVISAAREGALALCRELDEKKEKGTCLYTE